LTLANKITLGRLWASIILFILLGMTDEHAPSLGILAAGFFLFILVVATDALDGYFARKYGEVSDFGRIADPAVDKITVVGTLVFLCAMPWARPVLSAWMVVLVVGREIIVTGLRGYVESKGIDFSSDAAGKLKMIVQCCAVPGVFFFKMIELLFPDVGWAVTGSLYLVIGLMWLMLVLTVWSGFDYGVKAARLLRGRSA